MIKRDLAESKEDLKRCERIACAVEAMPDKEI